MKRENILFTLEQLNISLKSYKKLIDGWCTYEVQERYDAWVWEYKLQQTREAIDDLNKLLNETT